MLIIVSTLDRLIESLFDLRLQVDSFSVTFCLERDLMNHAFCTWVDLHTNNLATTHSSVDISLPSLLFPWIHGLRFLNVFFLSPYLPQPELYSMQVKAQLWSQRDKFIESTTVIFGTMDSGLLPLKGVNMSSLFRQFEGAADGIAVYQQDLNQLVDTHRKEEWYGSMKRAFIDDSSEVKTLQELFELGNRIRTQLYAIQESVHIGEDDSNAVKAGLRNFLDDINYTPDFDFSPTGFVVIPPSFAV